MSHGTHVFRNHITTALDERIATSGQSQVDGSTWRTAETNHVLQVLQTVLFRIAGSEHDVGNVLFNLFVQINLTNHLAGFHDVFCLQDGAYFNHFATDVLTDNLLFFFQLRIVDDDLQHETVHLCFRKRISTFLFNRVLCSHYEERLRKFEGFLAQCHLTFLHRFEQGTLHFGRGTVDFVRQYEVGEDRTTLGDELFVLLAINHGTDYVGREQVWSKLDTAIFRIDERCKCLDGKCLGQSRHPFQQDVSVGQQANQQRFNQMFLTHDGLVHTGHQVSYESALSFNLFVQSTNINSFCHSFLYYLVILVFTRRAVLPEAFSISP